MSDSRTGKRTQLVKGIHNKWLTLRSPLVQRGCDLRLLSCTWAQQRFNCKSSAQGIMSENCNLRQDPSNYTVRHCGAGLSLSLLIDLFTLESKGKIILSFVNRSSVKYPLLILINSLLKKKPQVPVVGISLWFPVTQPLYKS